MKFFLTYIIGLAFCDAAFADQEAIEGKSITVKHAEGAERLANDQDELSADVQQLIMEQTVPKVIELLNQVEGIMDETTDYLSELDTGGKTIAAQTEIIEKIHEAAKAKQQQGGAGEAGSAMMDMMERMMGKKAEEKAKGGGEKGKPGDQAGMGNGGDSDAENTSGSGVGGGDSTERRVPKAAGKAGKSLPSEFQTALDAYNRGLEGIGK